MSPRWRQSFVLHGRGNISGKGNVAAGVAIGMLINVRFAADLAKADAVAESISSLTVSSREELHTFVALVSASCFYAPICTSGFNGKGTPWHMRLIIMTGILYSDNCVCSNYAINR